VWSWTAPGGWGPLDLQRLRWNDGFGVTGYVLVTLVAVASAALFIRPWRKRVVRETGGLSNAISWVIPVVSAAVVAVTLAVLILDATISPWSPARQNLEALGGRATCGLALHLQGNRNVIQQLSDPSTLTLSTPVVAFYFPCTTIPRIEHGLVQAPAFVASESSSPWPLYDRAGPFAAVSDLYALREVAQGPSGVEVLSVADRVPGFNRIDAVRVR